MRSLFNETAKRAALRVRREYPSLVAIFLHGSAARGEPGPFSDIDLLAVTNRGKKPTEFSYFDGGIYVGVGFLRIRDLRKEFTDPEAFFWARGSAERTTILYDPRGVLRTIMTRWKHTKPSHQIIEKSLWDAYHNIIEYSGKMRNGWRKKDEYMTRYSARIIAGWIARAIIALNEISIISENYIWKHISSANRKPKHLGTDYPLAYGTRGTEQTEIVFRAAMRLCRETLRLIRKDFGNRARHRLFQGLLAEPLEKHGL